MQHGRRRLAHVETHAPARDTILIRFGPALGAGHDLDTVGPKRVQLARRARDRNELEIGIARDEEMPRRALEQIGARLARIGFREEIEERMRIERARAVSEHQRQTGDGFRDQPHAAIDHRVFLIALARERRIVARRPARPAFGKQRHKRAGARGFCFVNIARVGRAFGAHAGGGRGAAEGIAQGELHGASKKFLSSRASANGSARSAAR